MSNHSATTTTDPGPEPPSPYRRLHRRRDQAYVAGVAAGLGEYFAIDPVVFRIAFVVATFVGGAGLIAYILLWWLVPEVGEPRGDRQRLEGAMDRFRRLPTWVGVVLLIIGAAALAQGIGPWHPAVFWGVALIGVGLLLFFKGTDRDERGPSTLPPGTAGPMAPPPAISAGPAAYAAPTTVPLPPPGQATVSAAPAVGVPRRRERSSLGWITIGTLLVAIAVAVLLDSAGAISLSLAQYLALAISVLGLGLLAGARWGRARWLIAPAILLVPPLLAASLVQVPLRGGVGQRYYRPAAESDVGSVYRLAVGQLVVDLRDVPFGFQPKHITVTVGLGQVQVVVPRDVSIVVVARSGAGQASLFDQIYDGLKVDVTRTYEPPGASGQLQLDIEAGLGQVVLTHEPQNLS